MWILRHKHHGVNGKFRDDNLDFDDKVGGKILDNILRHLKKILNMSKAECLRYCKLQYLLDNYLSRILNIDPWCNKSFVSNPYSFGRNCLAPHIGPDHCKFYHRYNLAYWHMLGSDLNGKQCHCEYNLCCLNMTHPCTFHECTLGMGGNHLDRHIHLGCICHFCTAILVPYTPHFLGRLCI